MLESCSFYVSRRIVLVLAILILFFSPRRRMMVIIQCPWLFPCHRMTIHNQVHLTLVPATPVIKAHLDLITLACCLPRHNHLVGCRLGHNHLVDCRLGHNLVDCRLGHNQGEVCSELQVRSVAMLLVMIYV